MVLKFVRDHAWKFPSTPPLTLKWGAERFPENPPEPIPGVSGASESINPALVVINSQIPLSPLRLPNNGGRHSGRKGGLIRSERPRFARRWGTDEVF